MTDGMVTEGADPFKIDQFQVVLLNQGFCENRNCMHRSERPELAVKYKGRTICKHCGIKVLKRLAGRLSEAISRLQEAIENEPLPNQLSLF